MAGTFRPPQPNEPLLVGKPTSSCVFTSGGTSSWPGRWSGIAAAERPDRDPLWAWRLEPLEPPRELRITGAREWCEFVAAYPRQTTRGLVPVWFRVAEDYDAVTVTAAAVVTTQGMERAYRDARIAPTFWDVSTTVWTRWCFGRTPSSFELPRA